MDDWRDSPNMIAGRRAPARARTVTDPAAQVIPAGKTKIVIDVSLDLQ